jgi:hypothetical protein
LTRSRHWQSGIAALPQAQCSAGESSNQVNAFVLYSVLNNAHGCHVTWEEDCWLVLAIEPLAFFWLTGGRMSKNFARVFLTMLLMLVVVGAQPQLAFGAGTKPSTKSAETKCIKAAGTCLHTCDGKTGAERSLCEISCGSKSETCLNNVKAISVNPTTQTQKVKQNPAAAEQTTTSKKGGVDVHGTRKSGSTH